MQSLIFRARLRVVVVLNNPVSLRTRNNFFFKNGFILRVQIRLDYYFMSYEYMNFKLFSPR
jgi:hypothetical protein